MIRYNLGIRWDTGEVEGFSAEGLDELSAKKRAEDKAYSKLTELRRIRPLAAYVHVDRSQVTDTEFQTLQHDWKKELL